MMRRLPAPLLLLLFPVWLGGCAIKIEPKQGALDKGTANNSNPDNKVPPDLNAVTCESDYNRGVWFQSDAVDSHETTRAAALAHAVSLTYQGVTVNAHCGGVSVGWNGSQIVRIEAGFYVSNSDGSDGIIYASIYGQPQLNQAYSIDGSASSGSYNNPFVPTITTVAFPDADTMGGGSSGQLTFTSLPSAVTTGAMNFTFTSVVENMAVDSLGNITYPPNGTLTAIFTF